MIGKEDEPHKVVHQIVTDIPSYEVITQSGQPCILHHNQLLLIASEPGVPLCVGVCQACDQCTSPTPIKPSPKGSERETTPWEDSGPVITQCQASKDYPGVDQQEATTSPMDIHQSIHRGWVKTLGNV